MQHPRRDQRGTTPRGGRGSLRRAGPAMDVKYRFRKGDVAKPTTKKRPAASRTNPTGRLLLSKLHPRLKTDILRTDSANPESKVRTVERLVVFCFFDGPSISGDENESMSVLNQGLVAPPTDTIAENVIVPKTKNRLVFDDASSNAGFHNYSSSGPFYRM